jgi:dephospho-CoA kinase
VLRVGLTGGIGSGKSAVAARLGELGATIIDADALAREVVAPGTQGLAEIVATFGPEVLTPDGSLDRPGLGRLVFGDEDALTKLNAITHPKVGALMIAAVKEAEERGDAAIVYDVPLLVESKLQEGYDAIIVVECPREIRLERLEKRGLPRAEAEARMAAQATDEERRAVATVVLDNSGTLDELNAQVDRAWAELLARV